MLYGFVYGIPIDFIFLIFLVGGIFIFIVIKTIEVEKQKELEQIFIELDEFKENILLNKVDLYEETLVSKYYYKINDLITILKSQSDRNNEGKKEIQKNVANISHQVKNSLAIVSNYYELKSMESYDENDLVIKNEIDKMQFLFNSLIKISRIEISDIVINLEEVDINYLCLKLVKDTYKMAKDKNITIKFVNGSKQNVLVDLNWTMEALFNVVHNSIKYSEDGSVIEISITKYYSFVSIKIKDYGTGIDEKDIKNIFGKFYRGKNAYEFEGLGIGLFLSQEIINRQSGFIKVVSELDKFTEFEIFFKVNSENGV